MRKLSLLFIFFVQMQLHGQNPTYFPPAGNTTWDTISTQPLGWCQVKIDTLLNFLQVKQTRGFIILKHGKIAIEKYYGTFTKDSLWYWASAGKSLTAFLTGMAQEEGSLNINDSTSKYLGVGWTVEPPEKEGLIKIRNQLTMTTGLDYTVADNDCTIDTCLEYLADAGSFWAYYTGPYRLINDVIVNATGINYNAYTNSHVKTRIGMSSGIWLQDVFYSRTRDAARFGLLMQNKGIWNGDVLMQDTVYYNAMINTSQAYNESYGYLWWLNGKSHYMLPGPQFVFDGSLVPTAPADMYAALGKNDQKIYVVPSLDMVVVRFGDYADGFQLALSTFDLELWERIMDLDCTTGLNETLEQPIIIYPNPSAGQVTIALPANNNMPVTITVYDVAGNLVQSKTTTDNNMVLNLQAGLYFARITTANRSINTSKKFVVVE